jgi:aspartate aminotransferase
MKVATEAAKLRSEGIDVVDFGAGEPDFPTPDHIKAAAVEALDANFTRYTPSAGIRELRHAVCQWHRGQFETNYRVEECIITVGGKHAVFGLTQAVLNPGDDVIIPSPYWVTYKDVVNYAGANCVFIETDEREGFRLTAAMVERSLTPRTRLIIINSPSNPSGAVLDVKEFERIFRLAADHGAYLMTDECYSHFLYDSAPYSIAAMPDSKRTVLVAGSLSKTYAMTGWRIGYALGPASVVNAMNMLQSHSTSNPTSIAQKAAIAALMGPQDSIPQMLEEYRKRRDFVVARLRRMPKVTCAEPRGAFYAFPDIAEVLNGRGIRNSTEFAEHLLNEERVAVVPGEAFGADRNIRISYATSIAELERGLDRLHRFIEKKA